MSEIVGVAAVFAVAALFMVASAALMRRLFGPGHPGPPTWPDDGVI